MPAFQIILALLFCIPANAQWIGTPPAHVSRVVSLAPSLTEIIFALHADDALVGVTRFDTYPPEVLTLPRVGGFADLDMERIHQAKPGAIVTVSNAMPTRQLEALAARGIPTLILPASTMQDLWDAIDVLGKLFNKKSAGVLREKLQGQYGKLKGSCGHRAQQAAPLPERRVMLVVSSKPWVVVGSDNFLHEAMAWMGLKNAIKSPIAYPMVDEETVKAADPDLWIDLSHEGLGKGGSRTAPTKVQKKTRMIRPRNIDPWVRLGPRFPEALQELAQDLECIK